MVLRHELVFLSVAVCFTSALPITALGNYIINLKGFKDLTNDQKVLKLDEFLKNSSYSVFQKEEILKNFSFELEIISRNELLLLNDTIREAILKVNAENGANTFLQCKNCTSKQKMEDLAEYLIRKYTYFNNYDINEILLNYFNESFIWEEEHGFNVNPYTYSFFRMYVPSEIEEIIVLFDTKQNKMEKIRKFPVYRRANVYEKKLLEMLYAQLIDPIAEASGKHIMLSALAGLMAERTANATKFEAASSVYNTTFEIMNDRSLNEQKKMRKFRQYAEGLSSRSTDISTGKLKPEELEHYTNFFNLTLTMDQTLDDIFGNSVLRKKVFPIFVAKLYTNFSDFAFSDNTIPTYSRIEALPAIEKNIFDGLSPREVETLKRYFELYIEWDYVFQGVFNKPYERFCEYYLVDELMEEYNEEAEDGFGENVIWGAFRTKYWIDEEELGLVNRWYRGKFEENEKKKQIKEEKENKLAEFLKLHEKTGAPENTTTVNRNYATISDRDYWSR